MKCGKVREKVLKVPIKRPLSVLTSSWRSHLQVTSLCSKCYYRDRKNTNSLHLIHRTSVNVYITHVISASRHPLCHTKKRPVSVFFLQARHNTLVILKPGLDHEQGFKPRKENPPWITSEVERNRVYCSTSSAWWFFSNEGCTMSTVPEWPEKFLHSYFNLTCIFCSLYLCKNNNARNDRLHCNTSMVVSL